ncbi:VOC family protein [Vibrio kyushuensis]|uniref:VOC family protein n=1 Tax=Vibrio kyushuensis TaxID=2910249 RepID=UPI003D0E53C7
MKSYVEHANISVVEPKKTIAFLTAAIPSWEIRGGGKYEDATGKQIEWCHVGDDQSYIALGSNGKGDAEDWTAQFTGVKHIGIVVPNIAELEARLTEAGYELDHRGAPHPHRINAYYMEDHNIQFEFIEYLSELPAEKNDYTA